MGRNESTSDSLGIQGRRRIGPSSDDAKATDHNAEPHSTRRTL